MIRPTSAGRRTDRHAQVRDFGILGNQIPMADRKLARRFLVRGRVQGVGFRWFVEREAHILGLAGWVRNNSDGRVEVLAQGTPEQLSGLRARLQQGPRAARVDDVEESEANLTQDLKTFRIEGAW
jgi:acylphosphatase